MANGVILAYSDDVSAGVIRGDDGKSYYFSKAEWTSPDAGPESGLSVAFSPGDHAACSVRILANSPAARRK